MGDAEVGEASTTTAVIGAMEEEVSALLQGLQHAREENIGPFRLHHGVLQGQRVVVAHCGVGKVNAAALTQALLMGGVARVVFTGVAGALDPTLRVGDIVVSTDAVQYDVDVTALGYARGEVPGSGRAWGADASLQAWAVAAAEALSGVNVHRGTVASADRFLADPVAAEDLHRELGALCVEMEGAAVAQLCTAWHTPFVIVRSISDTADHAAEIDFRSFTELAAERARLVVEGVLRRMLEA